MNATHLKTLYALFTRICSTIMVLIVIISAIGVDPVSAMMPALDSIQAPLDNMIGWAYHSGLNVHNSASTPLPIGYTTGYVLDTASLISQNRLQSDCEDLRVAYGVDPAETELDRLVEGCNTASTTVRFRTQASIPVGGDDHNYHLYYGNDSAGAAPADPRNVFALYDDFQDGDAAGWNPAKGNWGVVDDGGNFIYRYTSGGANWALSYVPLAGVSDLDYIARVRASASTNWIGLAFRIQDQNNFLTFYESKDVNLFKLARIANDNHVIDPSTPVYTLNAGSWYWVRLQALGSTVRARIWLDGVSEPSTWVINSTETTYQTQTNIGATLYNHTTSADWDDIQVRKLVDVEPTVEIYEPVPPITDWFYRAQIDVTNSSASATLPAKYTAQLVLDTSNLIDSGRMLATCEDLQVGSVQGADVFEIDRVVENCNTANTRVWFALKRPILPSANDAGYYLYYGDPSPQPPLANEMNVFIFFEDWEKGAAHWTSSGGLDPANTGTMGLSIISNENSISPANSQKFPVKAGGGDAFSGYIPVVPSTSYAIGVWAKSGANTYAPVGIGPYTAAYALGSEQWLWTNEWTIGPAWAWRSAQFTTSATTAFIKIKSEWWAEAPGDQPVYMDNLFLRYAIASEPTLTLGEEETTLVVPIITNILDDGPVNLGSPVSITAEITTTEGEINNATLRIVSPISLNVPMSLNSGTSTNGVWQGSYTPSQGGEFSYRILAHATTGRQITSPLHTFSVIDNTPPVITQLTFTDPILVNNTQTVTVNVADNGVVNSVSLTVGSVSHPMTQSGSQYSYAWKVTTIGEIPFTVTATDSANNQSHLDGSFNSQAREVDICTWEGCRQGAASWSEDDGNNACLSDLTAAGIHGTFYYNGTGTNTWFADYSALGHEISSHTVGHPCNTPSCSPTCTEQSLAALPVDPATVTAYRLDQLEPNIAAIEAGTGKPVLSLAWPCGCTDPSRWQAASSYYLGARGYSDYIAQLTWVEALNNPTPVNFMNLNTAASYRQDFVDQAYSEGKWSITTSHGSCTGIDYLGAQNANGHLWVAPIGEVLKYIQVRDASQFSNYSRAGRTISFDVVHTLPTFQPLSITAPTPYSFLPIVFDNPVTLKIHILDTDSVLSVTVDDVPVASPSIQILDGTRYITFDAALNTTRHVVVNLGAPAPAVSNVSEIPNPMELGTSATVAATVIPAEGTSLGSVTLQVLSPESHDYTMAVVSGNQYAASFTPAQLGTYSFQVIATNSEGIASQSSPASFTVVDTTPPSSQAQLQSQDQIAVGGTNVLSAQGRDLGGMARAILSTNESGTWQDFDWPVTDWWNHNWANRRAITVTEAAGLARSNETVDLLVSSNDFNGLTSCVNELRVADTAPDEIPSQVYGEQVDGGGVRTCHLLFQATVGANASRTYYVYYGNPTATAPTYTTDLASSTAGTLLNVRNTILNLDLDNSSGIVSRVQLPTGTNANLPLSTQTDAYWGWHQVCSSLDGNITGKNNLCTGGSAPATGLILSTLIDGPIVKEFVFTSQKDAATYRMIYRFFANAPYYQYNLAVTGTTAKVMNNYWYTNGSFSQLGAGTGGTPASTYNAYGSGVDQIRMASFDSTIDFASIDGLNNDGTQLGGTDYRFPSASGLNLWVTTGASQADTELGLGRLAAPVTAVLGAQVEEAPETQYGSPVNLNGAVVWTPAAFLWQNPAIPVGTDVQWRIKFCDLSGNCASTADMTFSIVAPNTPPVAVNDSYTADENLLLSIATPGVLSNDSDADLDPLTAVTVTEPAHGTLTLNTNGSFVYIPDAGYKGDDTFTYKANDGVGDSNIATVTITVTDVLPTNANAGGPYTAVAGQPITLSGSVTCAIADACMFAWDLDGDTAYDDATGVSPIHTWNTVGGYTIHLQVTDDDGNSITDTASVTINPSTHSISLMPGWNLVSFNLHPTNTNIAAVLSSIAGNYDLVYAWDATGTHSTSGNWMKYYPTGPSYQNTLASLDETMGFWIHMTTTDILDVVGNVPVTTSINLSTNAGGWNLVAYPSVADRQLPDALSNTSVGTDFTLVYAYHANDTADPWKLFDRTGAPYANDLTQLTPGWGYWIKVNADHTWTIMYLAN